MQELEVIEIDGVKIPHTTYAEYGVQGVGNKHRPIVNMDQYIDHSMDKELHYECLRGIAQCEKHYKSGMFWGDIPTGEGTSWTTILKNIEKYDPTGEHLDNIKKLIAKDNNFKSVYRYCYYAMGATIPWFFGLYLKENAFFDKTEGGKYTEAMEYFPLLKQYLDTLPFRDIGRVLFFCTYPGAGVTMHRDAHMTDHKDHNINLFFEGGSRPSFVWDEKKKEKIYLEKEARSYFFNNRDYHGVDPEPVFRYTLRVDGTFNDNICDQLGLVDGFTWKETY